MSDQARWQGPPDQSVGALYLWAMNLVRQFQRAEHKSYRLIDVTLSAGTTTAVATTDINAEHHVFLMPTNAAAAALSPYVSAVSPGASFTLTHGTAAGTETYSAMIIER